MTLQDLNGFIKDQILELQNGTEKGGKLLDKLLNRHYGKPPVVGSAIEIPDFVSEDQWWCPECNMIVEPECVTYEQTHDERCGGCGFMVW